jgi:exopolysaccharide biosynthesis polyprenyl glycosylphosphotransferase
MYKKEKRSWAKHLDFILIDMICFQIALILAYWIRLGFSSPYANPLYERLAVVQILIQICIIFFMEPYKDILRRNKVQELKAAITNATMVFIGIILWLYVTKQSAGYSRQVELTFWPMAIFFSYGGRVVQKRIVRRRFFRDRADRLVMIVVTTSDLAEACIADFDANKYRDYKVRGIVLMDADRTGETISQIPVVAGKADFFDYMRTNVVDEVFLNLDSISESEAIAEQLVEMGLTVHYRLVHESKLMPNKEVERMGRCMVMTSSMHIATPRQMLIKRCMDIVGSLVGLVITGIAFVIFAPQIKYQSPGPVFFSQVRVGKNGRPFKIYKFRSMNVNAEEQKKELLEQNEMEGLMFKMEDDPRVFPVGKFMRKYSIDELPQFWNVLKGEMSLVGTRPPTMDEFSQYEAHHRARLGIKPGLTGMWQVSGRSDIKDFEEVVRLDTEYISNWNLSMDVRILLKTIQVVCKGRGAS